MNIRNFCLIAHVDHGKSTLADRIMEICGAVPKDHQPQLLDSLALEREHGITIKLKAIRLEYRHPGGGAATDRISKIDSIASLQNDNHLPLTINDSHQIQNCILNLIDTPGHVDFSYEVSRSLASVEGAILVVDATQGVQAQTLANFNLALEAGLTIIPAVNKIDSPQAEIEKTQHQLQELGFSAGEILKISAKTGEGAEKVIEAIIERIPPPQSADRNSEPSPELSFPRKRESSDWIPNQVRDDKLAALIFDSSLDPYKGVIATVRLFDGQTKTGDQISFLATGAQAQVLQIGYLTPQPKYVDKIFAGEVGFIVTNLKDLSKVKVGDTITDPKNPAGALAGYRQAKPVVFLSFFPTDTKDLAKLKDALEKLKLNDSSLSYTTETSLSLGQGFRLGFLGLLHAQITQERLEREYNIDIIATSPSVNFMVDGRLVNKPTEFEAALAKGQSSSGRKEVKEPYAHITIFAPEKYYGQISNLVHERRGELGNIENLGNLQKIEVSMPLLELIIGFYDQLKSVTSGYGSLDFDLGDYKAADLVKLDILVNREPIEGLAQIVPRQKAEVIGARLVEKLKDAIPRQQIPIPVQAAIGSKIIARETIPAYRKDVTQKLYGGDVTRKMKLLDKQKKGKKRMRRFGNVDIPQDAFLAVLKL